tara:strand:- start:14 stop:415 length:402 start_codon:yes stop_codon:yes gene_type:complete
MAFKMKGFSGFGNSPMKQRKKYTKKDYDFLKKQREERVKSTDYLTKTPTGPRATKKPIKDDRLTIGRNLSGDIKLDPGFEDIKKIQRVQREGLTPHSQNFSKKAKKLKKKVFIDFENPKDRNKIYNKTEIKRP